MASICTGAFALAAAGVLDGRRATTHWRDTADLASMYPRVRVEPDVLYVDEGTLLTSAGVASGLDLCLHILRTDHGAALASHIARRLVVPPHREGGQAQYVDQPLPTHAGGSLASTRAWALEHLNEPLTVRTLAAHAHVSERTFARRFTAETGVPVLQWLLARRVDAARAALESTDATIDEIADTCGFGTAANLRKHFRRHVSTTPTAYRRTFAFLKQGQSRFSGALGLGRGEIPTRRGYGRACLVNHAPSTSPASITCTPAATARRRSTSMTRDRWRYLGMLRKAVEQTVMDVPLLLPHGQPRPPARRDAPAEPRRGMHASTARYAQ